MATRSGFLNYAWPPGYPKKSFELFWKLKVLDCLELGEIRVAIREKEQACLVFVRM